MEPTPFRVSTAAVFALGLSVAYVAVLWVDKTHRVGQRSYADPHVIRHRVVVASCTTAAELLVTALLVAGASVRSNHLPWSEALHFALSGLGLLVSVRAAVLAALVGVGLTSLMYVAQLVEEGLHHQLPGQANARVGRFVSPFRSPASVRNFIAGPLTEELVFRACVLAPFLTAQVGRLSVLFLCPVFFALAHTHHAYEHYVAHGRTRQAAILGFQMALVQVAYTFVFGWYANWLFLRSGTVFFYFEAPIGA